MRWIGSRWPWVLLVVAAACSPGDEGSEVVVPAASDPDLYVDATARSGVGFHHDNGAEGERLLPETMGSGVALIDYDGDGWLDLFFVNGAPSSESALYRNLGDLRFEDVTGRAAAGLRLVGMGAAVGDVDRDGSSDLFVTGVGEDVLLRNLGDGRFADASERVDTLSAGFGSGAAFLDADRDGWLDLYVGRYVTWTRESDVQCRPDGVHRSYCTPEVYSGASNRLLRNEWSEGGFVDVTAAAGVLVQTTKTLGIVPLDYDDDGWVDIGVANDTEGDLLFVNRGDGTFEDEGVPAGMALGQSGAPRGGMGIDAGDLDGDGRPDLVVGNFAQEMSAVLLLGRGGVFSDDSAELGVGLPSLLTLAFGTLIVDLDLDGWRDIVLLNGHIEPEIESMRPNQSYLQPMQAFRRVPEESRFELEASPVWSVGRVGRGLAAGDLDGDGDTDLVVTENGRPATLLESRAAETARWLAVHPLTAHGGVGTGTRAVLETSGGRRAVDAVSGRSYLSASEQSIVFGLTRQESPGPLEIRWPSGAVSRLEKPGDGRIYIWPERSLTPRPSSIPSS